MSRAASKHVEAPPRRRGVDPRGRSVVVVALALGACQGTAEAPAVATAAARTSEGVAAVTHPPGREIRLTPTASWGGVDVVRDEAAATPDTDTFQVRFTLAPSTPVTIRVPKGDTVALAPLPTRADAAPLEPGAYELTLLPATGTPTGLRFATRDRDGGDPFELQITRAHGDAYAIAGTIGGQPLGGTLEGLATCASGALSGMGPDLGLSPRALAAAAALERELAAHLPELDGGSRVLRAAVLVLGRRYLDVERLAATVDESPCGAASLELVCAEDTCALEQIGQALTLRRGDSLTMGLGTTTTFLPGGRR